MSTLNCVVGQIISAMPIMPLNALDILPEWCTGLGRKHRCSIKKVMRNHYRVDPKSDKRALHTSSQSGKCIYLWNKPPQRASLFNSVVKAKDVQPLPITDWSKGRSYEQRIEVNNRSENRCEHCGEISPTCFCSSSQSVR